MYLDLNHKLISAKLHRQNINSVDVDRQLVETLHTWYCRPQQIGRPFLSDSHLSTFLCFRSGYLCIWTYKLRLSFHSRGIYTVDSVILFVSHIAWIQFLMNLKLIIDKIIKTFQITA